VHSSHDITPYEELYGKHPNMFNFDADGNMVPPSPVDSTSPVASPESSPMSGCGKASFVGNNGGSSGFSSGLAMADTSSVSTPAAGLEDWHRVRIVVPSLTSEDVVTSSSSLPSTKETAKPHKGDGTGRSASATVLQQATGIIRDHEGEAAGNLWN